VRGVPADVSRRGAHPGYRGGLHGLQLGRRRLAARAVRGHRLHPGHRSPHAGGHARFVRDHAGRVGRVRGGSVRGGRLPRLYGRIDDPQCRRPTVGRPERLGRSHERGRAARHPAERSESEADPVLLRLPAAVPRRLAWAARSEAVRARRGVHADDPGRVRNLRVRERRHPRPRARRARRPTVDRAVARRAPDRVRRQARGHGSV
ncbi:MAG: RhtB family transporter, partial [uncultured Rubrobacteraceae bacterium]